MKLEHDAYFHMSELTANEAGELEFSSSIPYISGLKVNIHFCGGCNPLIERKNIASQLDSRLREMGYCVVYNCSHSALVIFLSGCTSDCASNFNPTNSPFVTVSGSKVDGKDVLPACIVSEVLMRIADIGGAGRDSYSNKRNNEE